MSIPAALDARPKYKGLPVPVTVPWEDGVPDFKGTDLDAWVSVVTERLCALCGESMPGYVAFIGGPACQANGIFHDPAMHEACARAAMKLCPFIMAKKDYAASTKRLAHSPMEGPAVHPASMLLMLASGYSVVRLPLHGPAARAALPWLHVEIIPKSHRADGAGTFTEV